VTWRRGRVLVIIRQGETEIRDGRVTSYIDTRTRENNKGNSQRGKAGILIEIEGNTFGASSDSTRAKECIGYYSFSVSFMEELLATP
jgi:hypothetical protein